MSRFIFGRTEFCCKCYGIATNWNGWLIKSRDGVVAGFCEEHKPEAPNIKTTYGSHNLRGIYDKKMGFKEKKTQNTIYKYGLNKNLIEQ